MAYVRQRTTKAGALSTALVEAYRDEQGRPRQGVLANMQGEPDTLRALARLIVQRAALRKHRAEEWAEVHSGEYEEELVAEFFAEIDGDLAAALHCVVAILNRADVFVENWCSTSF
jgi:hypothetical protein